jgi:hypothetical protein
MIWQGRRQTWVVVEAGGEDDYNNGGRGRSSPVRRRAVGWEEGRRQVIIFLRKWITNTEEGSEFMVLCFGGANFGRQFIDPKGHSKKLDVLDRTRFRSNIRNINHE